MARQGSTVDESVRNLAIRFAEEVARAVRGGMANEVAAQVNAVLRNATRHVDFKLNVAGGPGDRRIGKLPVVVKCAVPRCREDGIRAKRNFCAAHSASLTDSEKRAIRDGQKARAPRPARGAKSIRRTK